MLCQGYRRNVTTRAIQRDEVDFCTIPGLVSTSPNDHVEAMKAAPWPRVLATMGKEGEKTMIDLILDCGIFLPIKTGRGNYHQLSGE